MKPLLPLFFCLLLVGGVLLLWSFSVDTQSPTQVVRKEKDPAPAGWVQIKAEVVKAEFGTVSSTDPDAAAGPVLEYRYHFHQRAIRGRARAWYALENRRAASDFFSRHRLQPGSHIRIFVDPNKPSRSLINQNYAQIPRKTAFSPNLGTLVMILGGLSLLLSLFVRRPRDK